MLTAYFYLSPTDTVIGQSETVEIHTSDAHVVADDVEVRDHPEVPLTALQRDSVLSRMRYRRVGEWTTDQDESACALVEAVHGTPAQPHGEES
ncbi:hypothetical protein ACIQC7_34960 [Kitasatospora sp. NPDC088556]|uniref:hypothetical protein n=1 Tax=Kitasatospora sp. NPDC088556 TaxID=3364076 RepID=UPI00381DB74C